MAHEWDLHPHIMEIKERLSSIEQICKDQKEDLQESSRKSLEMQKEVSRIRSELDLARGTLIALKWAAPTAPALLIAILKIAGII